MGDPVQARKACEARLARLKRSGIPSLFRAWDEVVDAGESRLHVIMGRTGSGKSTLALLYAAYRYGCDIGEIERRLVWRPDHFLEAYRRGSDILIWDDAGVWFRIMAKAPLDPLTVTISAIFDVGRLQVPLVLATMTTDRDLPRGIRYNSMIYNSRTRVWRVGWSEQHKTYRAMAVTQYRREKADWSQSYWDASRELVYKFYLFRKGDPFYAWYLARRKEYALFFLDYALKRIESSKLYGLLRASTGD